MEPGNWGVTEPEVVTPSSWFSPAPGEPGERAPLTGLVVRQRRFGLRQAIVDLAAHDQAPAPDQATSQRLSEAAATAALELAAAGDDEGLRDILRPDPDDEQVIWTVACYQIGDLTPTALRDFADPAEAVTTLAGCGESSHLAAEMVASTASGLRWTVLERAGSVSRLHLLSGDRGAGASGEVGEVLGEARRRWADRLGVWGAETEPSAGHPTGGAVAPEVSWARDPLAGGARWPATGALTAALAALAAGAGLPPGAGGWSVAEQLRDGDLDGSSYAMRMESTYSMTVEEVVPRLDRAGVAERSLAADARAREAEERAAVAEARAAAVETRLGDILARHAAGLEEATTDHIVELAEARAAAQIELGTVGDELARVVSHLDRLDERIQRLEPATASSYAPGVGRNLTVSVTLPRLTRTPGRSRRPPPTGGATSSWGQRVRAIVVLLSGLTGHPDPTRPGPTRAGRTTPGGPIDIPVPPH